jgi:hypothetical protein
MKILVCPLDWGLGHAARCVPVIRELRERGHDIVLGAYGRSREFLAGEFPDLECLHFPGITVRYPAGKRFAFFYVYKIFGFLGQIAREHRGLRSLVMAHRFEMVVSDGRVGLFTRLCPSVLITHQLFFKFPRWEVAGVSWGRWLETVFFWFFRPILRRFSQVWVPDFASPHGLTGELSHRRTSLKNIRFIGPLCRLSPSSRPDEPASAVDRLALVSGPEPQRTMFERTLKAILRDLPGRNLMLLGKPEEARTGGPGPRPDDREDGLRQFPHADEETMSRLMRAAGLIITRPGYTTVMELAGLGIKKVLFVPTPGQTEQEYLARSLEEQRIAPWRDQSRLSPEDFRLGVTGYRGFEDLPRQAGPGGRLPVPMP